MLIKKTNTGFTLIELLIVVVILGLLAAIAVPNYMNNVTRSRRADARSALMQNAQYMERFLTENNRYDINLAGGAPVLPFLVTPNGATGAAIDYNLSFPAAPTATTFTIQAVPRSGGKMNGDACGTYVINNAGARSNVGNTLSVDDCWTK